MNKNNPPLFKIITAGVRGISTVDYKNNITAEGDEKIKQDNYTKYKNILNKEIWPRPYYNEDDAYEVDVLTTDIFYRVRNDRAKWITGKGDVDKEWDSYVKALNNMGLKDYMNILQRSYDTFKSNAK